MPHYQRTKFRFGWGKLGVAKMQIHPAAHLKFKPSQFDSLMQVYHSKITFDFHESRQQELNPRSLSLLAARATELPLNHLSTQTKISLLKSHFICLKTATAFSKRQQQQRQRQPQQ